MLIPQAKPGSSTENKTGTWRSAHPIVDGKKCVKCAICQNFCPEGIMGEPGKTPEIDYAFCKGCGVCANECPVKCIEMKQDEGK